MVSRNSIKGVLWLFPWLIEAASAAHWYGETVRVHQTPHLQNSYGLLSSAWNQTQDTLRALESLGIRPLPSQGHAKKFYFHNLPLCKVSIVDTWVHGQRVMLGNLPKVSVSEIDARVLQQRPQPAESGFIGYCLARTSQWEVVAEQVVRQGHAMVREFVGMSGLIHREPLAFHLQGSGTAYAWSPADSSTPIQAPLYNLAGDGTLTTPRLTTLPNGGVSRAMDLTHSFMYGVNDLEFIEVNLFFHAQKFLHWFESIGYQWSGGVLTLRPHTMFGGDPNNAIYEPVDETGNPSISVGNGDGAILRNLGLDGDVVAHEFGHHVIFETLQSVDGESLVLHEGLADYFAFAHTNDSCLGESICPDDSLACYVRSQCLRTADNTITYDSEAYQDLIPHLQGQIISGLLWDMRQDIAPEAVTALAFHSLAFLPYNAGIFDFLAALLLADYERYDGAYCPTLLAAMDARGFQQHTKDLMCRTPPPVEEEPPPQQPDAESDEKISQEMPDSQAQDPNSHTTSESTATPPGKDSDGDSGSSTSPPATAPSAEKNQDKDSKPLPGCGSVMTPVHQSHLWLLWVVLVMPGVHPVLYRKRQDPL